MDTKGVTEAEAIIDLMRQRGYKVFFTSSDNLVICTAHHPALSRAGTATNDKGDAYAAVRTVAEKIGIDLSPLTARPTF